MQAHRLFYSPNRPLRVAAATDIHRRCCQNCCQTSKLLSNIGASEAAKLMGSGPRLGRAADARNSSIATLIWMIARLDMQPSGLAVIRPDLQSGVVTQHITDLAHAARLIGNHYGLHAGAGVEFR